jgi:hypothetical protein
MQQERQVMLSTDSVYRQAEELIEVLVDHGPQTSVELCARLGWTRSRLASATKCAREQIGPALGISIPNPTPQDGWRYQATTNWEPIEAGASYVLGGIESRLRGISRDVSTVKPHLEKGSVEWRRANFLEKHLTHIVSTLGEINNG